MSAVKLFTSTPIKQWNGAARAREVMTANTLRVDLVTATAFTFGPTLADQATSTRLYEQSGCCLC